MNRELPTVITCLYQGEDVPTHSKGIFDAEWVNKLNRGLERNSTQDFNMICLVDKHYPDIDPRVIQVELETGFRNMFCLLEGLRPEVTGLKANIFMGLDTIIKGNIDFLLESTCKFNMLQDPYHKNLRASGVMVYQKKIAHQLYSKFRQWLKNQESLDGKVQFCGQVSDMIWLTENAPYSMPLQRIYPKKLISYKADYLEKIQKGKTFMFKKAEKIMDEAAIVYFHGVPKPDQLLQTKLVKENWL